MNELALFAGAGGGILGGHLLGWRTVCAVEWELETFKSSLKALEMKKYPDLPVSGQEREAYASEEYQQLCKAIGEATYNCELLKWRLMTAQMRFDAWRSEQANNRIMDRNVK
ncbi:DNA methyltransferase [Caudoviricetes sp.]|nr:DNA methyltransferase [Caudoviricetes sp.]